MNTASILALATAILLPGTVHAQISRSRTVTGPQGNTATRNVAGTYTPGSGYTRTATTTGPNGQTAGSTRTVTGAPHGRNVQTSAYGPNGNTASANVYRGRWGHVQAGTVTGHQGNTRGFTRIRR
jgi:hypothetical protein